MSISTGTHLLHENNSTNSIGKLDPEQLSYFLPMDPPMRKMFKKLTKEQEPKGEI